MMIEVPLSKAVRLISPRLTVLVNTVDEKGELNSSPYSWIFPLSFDPPFIGVGIGGKKKYTYIKLWERQGFHTEKSKKVNVPRIREARAVLECKVKQFVELAGDHIILVGEVLYAAAEEGGLDAIRPLLHDSGEKFRSIGKEIVLKRRR